MPAFGFPHAPAGTWVPIPADSYDFHHQSPEAYECDIPRRPEKHAHSEQDYFSDSSSHDSRCGYGDGHNGNTVKHGVDSYHHADDDKYDTYCYADVQRNYESAINSPCVPACIPNNGISSYTSIPYSPSYPMSPPSWSAWSDLGTTSRPLDSLAGLGIPLFQSSRGMQTTSSVQTPYATLAQSYGTTASLQIPAYAYRANPTLDSLWWQVADSSHTISTELTQPQVHNVSSNNHVEVSWGGTLLDEMTKTMTKASGSPVGEAPVDSSSRKEDNICDAENANDVSLKHPNLSSECELLLVSIYNMSTLLKNKLSCTEGRLDVNMLESTIGLLSGCLLKQSTDNSTKLTCKLSPKSQQSIQEPSSKPDFPPYPSITSNKDTAPSAEGALSHKEDVQIVEEAVVKSLWRHEHEGHQAGGVLDDEPSFEEPQNVPCAKTKGSSHSPSTHVCNQMLSDAAEEFFEKGEKQGDVSEFNTSQSGSMDKIFYTCDDESGVAFNSDAEDWEYVTSPSPGRVCSVFKL